MPFKSEAQRRWMYANKPEMAKKWEKHTPDDKDLPEHKKESFQRLGGATERAHDMKKDYEDLPKRTKISAFWDMLVKLGAVDPTIKSYVARVAKKIGVDPPSAAELEEMFPPGWEKTTPSWQEQLHKSQWMRRANMSSRGGVGPSVGAAGSTHWGPGAAESAWKSTGKVPWYTRAAGRAGGAFTKHLLPITLLTALGHGTQGLVEDERLDKTLKNKGVPKKYRDALINEKRVKGFSGLSPERKKGLLTGMTVGGVLGAGAPFATMAPAVKALGIRWRDALRSTGRALPLTAAAAGMIGSSTGGLLGILATTRPEHRHDVREALRVAKERDYIK